MKGYYQVTSEFGKIYKTFDNWLDAKHWLLAFCHCGWHSDKITKSHPNGEVFTDKYNVKWYIKTDKELV